MKKNGFIKENGKTNATDLLHTDVCDGSVAFASIKAVV